MTATLDAPNSNIFVLFSEVLNGGLLNTGNWTGRVGGFAVTAAVVLATASFAIVNYVTGAADAGPDEVSYSAVVPDVVGAGSGLPAAAFASLPIV